MARDRDLVREGEATGQINATIERQTGFSDLSLTLRRNGRARLPSIASPCVGNWTFWASSMQYSFPAWI